MLEIGAVRRSPIPLTLLFAAAAATAQAEGSAWQRPPEVIVRQVTASPPPATSLSPQGSWLAVITSEALPGLDVVARPHRKLAGLRIDPETFGRPLGAQVTGIELRAPAGTEVHAVAIEPGHWSGPIWSADDASFVLVRDAAGGGELWFAATPTAAPRRVAGVRLNQALGDAVQWLPDQRRLLVKLVVSGDPPARPRVPSGPETEESVAGVKAPVRTYQDLLADAYDDALLDFYGRSRLAIVDPKSGAVEPIGAPALYERVEPSPDGSMLLVERVERPFSHAVPLSLFPRATVLLGIDGAERRGLYQHGVLEYVPIGGVPKGPRDIAWVPTMPHVLYWVEAQDGGDPRTEVPHRDFVFLLPSPDETPRLWFKTEHRAARLAFGADGRLVLAGELDRKTRRERQWRYDLTDPARPGELLYERSTQDVYGDPGRPIDERLLDGREVLRMRDGALFLSGRGASPTGERPFVDRWVVASGEKQRLFEAAEGRYESFVGFLGDAGDALLVRSESPSEPPSLLVVDRDAGTRRTLLQLRDAAAEWTSVVEKRLVRYQREDGLPLSGTLYLPPGRPAGEKVPCVVWAYPLEYTEPSDAGQVRAAPNRYLAPRGSSHLFLLLHGYAVFDDAAMPIVGPRRTANDTFVAQLQQNARAAVAALAAEEVVDTSRLAVAGHSYGAFMTANLLAHTDLFACGIARSGAYNRSLTPFGFQNEERTFWEAPEVYQAMSPFSHADRIDEPLLLIHGTDDNNSGTFPIQSERLFAAIKGHGGTARLCMLPFESHGYRSRECVLQCLAEMCAWLDRYCKPRGG